MGFSMQKYNSDLKELPLIYFMQTTSKRVTEMHNPVVRAQLN
jgi:hypothetical protein